MSDFSDYLDEQFEKAKQKAIENEVNEIKVTVTLTFEYVLIKPKDKDIK